MEDTNQSLTKEEYEALVACKESKEDGDSSVREGEKSTEEVVVDLKEKIVEVGANAKKRKVAKIVGNEQDDAVLGQTSKKQDTKSTRKPKKKANAVKLTFGDEEG